MAFAWRRAVIVPHKDKDCFAKESNLVVNTVKAMGACGSKDAVQLVEAPFEESPPAVKAPVVVEKKKEPEKVEPEPEETEENPGYEVPAMVSSSVSASVCFSFSSSFES